MTFRLKIYVFTFGLLFIILLLMNVGIYFSYHHFMIEKQAEELENQAERIVDNVSMVQLREGDDSVLEPYRMDDGLVRFINTHGQTVEEIVDEGDLSDISPQMVQDQMTKQATADDQPVMIYRYPVTLNEDDDDENAVGTLTLAVSLESMTENISSLLSIMIAVSVSALLLSVLGGKWLAHLLLRPVAALNTTMKNVEESGEFQKLDISKQPKDELYELSLTFNRMIDRLQKTFEKQKQFVSDASHELKTPLTAIESYVAMLRRWGGKDPDVREEALDTMHTEGQRMRDLIEQLLDLASSENEEEHLPAEDVDVVALCEAVTHESEAAYAREIMVRADQHPVVRTWNRQTLRQVLSILLDNALKYSEHPVDIYVGEEEGRAIVAVKDEGIGISAADQARMFERFYRADASRQRGGTGLGLAIAQSLAEKHGGMIHVDSEEGKGTRVTVFLS